MKFFNQCQAAEYLGVSVTTFWRLRKDRGLKGIVLSKRTLYTKDELDSLFTQQPGPYGLVNTNSNSLGGGR